MNFKSIFKFLGSLVIVSIVVIIAAIFLWNILRTVWVAYASLSENVQVAVAAGLITLVTTVGSVVYTKIKEKKLQIEANNNQYKQKLYSEFTENIIALMSNPKKAEDEEWIEEIRLDFIKKSLLWADPRVLNTYRDFRINSQIDGDGNRTIYDIASLLLAFRKDLGLSNRKVNQHTIVDILFNRSDQGEFRELFPEKK